MQANSARLPERFVATRIRNYYVISVISSKSFFNRNSRSTPSGFLFFMQPFGFLRHNGGMVAEKTVVCKKNTQKASERKKVGRKIISLE